MLLNEIIVSTTVKSKEIKTVQMNNKDLMKKLLGIPITPCFYFLSLCCLINELEIRQYMNQPNYKNLGIIVLHFATKLL